MNFSKCSSVVLTLIWFSSFCLLPVLLWQGYFLRRAALRLPEAAPPNSGRFCSSETEMMIVGVGDSVIAGTGIGSLSNSVTARVAQTLASRFSTGVNWLTRGISGAKLEDLLARLKEEPLPGADIYLVSIGVNDVTGMTSLARWQLQVSELVTLLDERALILILGVPPMQHFAVIPWPLRQVLGVRAALLDKTFSQAAETFERVIWFDTSINFDRAYLARDGYHPNEEACVEIASKIVDSLILYRDAA